MKTPYKKKIYGHIGGRKEWDETEKVASSYIPWRASLVVQVVKNPPATWETWVWSLGEEDPLEKNMAIHSYSNPYIHYCV